MVKVAAELSELAFNVIKPSIKILPELGYPFVHLLNNPLNLGHPFLNRQALKPPALYRCPLDMAYAHIKFCG